MRRVRSAGDCRSPRFSLLVACAVVVVDRAEALVPPGGESQPRPGWPGRDGRLAPGEDLPFVGDQFGRSSTPGLRLPAENGTRLGQPVGAHLAGDQQVEDPATRRVGDGRPQLVADLGRPSRPTFRQHAGWHRPGIPPQPSQFVGIPLLHVGPVTQFVAARTPEAGSAPPPASARTHQHRAVCHRLLAAGVVPAGTRSEPPSTVSTTTWPPHPNACSLPGLTNRSHPTATTGHTRGQFVIVRQTTC